VNVHATWSNMTPAALNTIYSQLAAAGVTWVRIDMGWASFEYTARGQLTDSYVQIADNAVNSARSHGLNVLADLWSTPGWANGNQATNVPPTNPADYAWIANWAAAHFAGRVSAWEIWNEEDSASFWNPPNPAAYTALVKAAYPAFKAGDPNATVVLGGTSYNDTTYLSALYADGIHGSFDALATHPYEGVASNPPATADDGTEYTLTHVAAVHALMAQNGDGNLPIWFTELGWSDHSNATTPLASNGSTNWEQGVTDTQQGDYLVQTLRWVAQNAPYVTHTFAYEAANETGTDIQNANYGLLNTNLTPKPDYTILQQYLTQ
jgi:aryl-phospho-beta-D-glucosidase BglC (GH1 family)